MCRRPLGLSAHGAMACSWSTEWVESDPVELAMERDWLRNLAAEEGARPRAEDDRVRIAF